jgi:hypothetical protein
MCRSSRPISRIRLLSGRSNGLARDARLELLVNDAGMGDFGAFESRDPDVCNR